MKTICNINQIKAICDINKWDNIEQLLSNINQLGDIAQLICNKCNINHFQDALTHEAKKKLENMYTMDLRKSIDFWENDNDGEFISFDGNEKNTLIEDVNKDITNK